jgi:Rap/ran-GAP
LTTGIDADAFYTSAYIGVLPEDILQDQYSCMVLAALPSTIPEMPIHLPQDEALERTLNSFDLNSTVDGHKVGVIYIREGQTGEAEILANASGSRDYEDFLARLGTLIRLKGATFNTQGLDRSGDSDGLYAYCWRDRANELIFHVTTMMPTDIENQPLCVNKKQHIGNDFVNIIWNDSSEPFKFDTFPSAFNYVYIVITPDADADFVALRKSRNNGSHSANGGTSNTASPPTKDFSYKVQVLSAPGFPSISPAAEPKVVGSKALAPFVRLLALNASFFSLVWRNREGGEHYSPWRNRLREIKRLREKYAARAPNVRGVSSQSLGTSGLQPPSNQTGRNSHRASLAFGGGGGVDKDGT